MSSITQATMNRPNPAGTAALLCRKKVLHSTQHNQQHVSLFEENDDNNNNNNHHHYAFQLNELGMCGASLVSPLKKMKLFMPVEDMHAETSCMTRLH